MTATKKIQNSSISGTTLKGGPRGWRFGPGDEERELSPEEVAKVIKDTDEMLSAAAEGTKPAKQPKKEKGKRALANDFSKELLAQKFSGKPNPEKLAGIVAQIRELPDGKPTQAEFDLVKTTMVESGISLDDALDTLADSLQAGFDKAMDAIRDDPPIHASDMSKVYQDVDDKVKPIADGLVETNSRVHHLMMHVEQNGEYLDKFVEATQGDIGELGADVKQLKHDVGHARVMAQRGAKEGEKAVGLFHQVNNSLGGLNDDVSRLKGGLDSLRQEVNGNLDAAVVDQEEMYGVIGEWQNKVEKLEDKVAAINSNQSSFNNRLFNLENQRGVKPVADSLKDPWNTPRPTFTNVESEREDHRDAEEALEMAFEIKRLHQEIDSYTRTRQDIVDNDDQFASLNGKRLIAACDQKIAEMRAEIEELRGEFDIIIGGDIDIDADGIYPADENQFEINLRADPSGPRQLVRSEQRDILVKKLMGHAVYWSVHPKLDEETEAEHRYRICAGTVASVLGTLDGEDRFDSGYLVIPNATRNSASDGMHNNENYTAFSPGIHEHHQLSSLDISGGLKERAQEMTRSFRSSFRRKLADKA